MKRFGSVKGRATIGWQLRVILICATEEGFSPSLELVKYILKVIN